MDPAVGIAGVARRSKIVSVVIRTRRIERGRGHVGEWINAIAWPGAVQVFLLPESASDMGIPTRVSRKDPGEKSDTFRHRRLGDATML